MTRDEWLNATDPAVMLRWLQEQNLQREQDLWTYRKARLYAVAVCRRVWPFMTDERSRRAVEAAERDADGLIDDAEWNTVLTEVEQARDEANVAVAAFQLSSAEGFAVSAAVYAMSMAVGTAVASAAAYAVGFAAPEAERDVAEARERLAQACVLRDLFNPFFSTQLDPALRTPEVLALAQSIYESRSFDRLPELADVIVASGHQAAELLQHLRGPGPHAGRGCWALDEVLGKEQYSCQWRS